MRGWEHTNNAVFPHCKVISACLEDRGSIQTDRAPQVGGKTVLTSSHIYHALTYTEHTNNTLRHNSGLILRSLCVCSPCTVRSANNTFLHKGHYSKWLGVSSHPWAASCVPIDWIIIWKGIFTTANYNLIQRFLKGCKGTRSSQKFSSTWTVCDPKLTMFNRALCVRFVCERELNHPDCKAQRLS